MKHPTALLAGALVPLAAGVAWGGSELHYRSCVTAAIGRTPVEVTTRPVGGFGPDDPGPRQVSAVVGQAARQRAIDGCSRLP